MKKQTVYILSHTRNEEELEGFKIIGVFGNVESAEKAILAVKDKPGFRDYPDNFNIGGYDLDNVFWVDGFG